MKLVVGLGNPGSEYDWTRHNVGFEVVEGLASRHSASWMRKPDAEIARWGQTILAKPQTFMNLSGSAVQRWSSFYKIDPEDVLVVVDDVNLDAGRLRMRRSGSAGGHNGLKSIIGSLGTDQFPRLRVGVGRGDGRKSLSTHVLGKIEPAEEAIIEAAITKAVEAVEVFIAVGVVAAMDRYNRKDDDKTEDN